MWSRLWEKHEKSAAKYRKIVCEDIIRIKNSSSTNHMMRIIGGVKTKNQSGKGADFVQILHGFCAGKSSSMASIAG